MASTKTSKPFQQGQNGALLWDAHGRNPKAITFGPLKGALGSKEADIYLGDARIGWVEQVTEAENVARWGGNSRYKQEVVGYEITLFDDTDDATPAKIRPDAWRTRARAWIADRFNKGALPT